MVRFGERLGGVWAAALAAVLATCVALLVGPGVAVADSPRQLYVSADGRDSWPGTKQLPFATLQRAQNEVRTLTPAMNADIVVNLRHGTHELTRPLRLRDAAGDSGRNGHRVIYQAYGYGTPAEEDVTVSGGRRITGWHPFRNGIWRAEVGDLDTRQLYVGGRRATRASLEGGAPEGPAGDIADLSLTEHDWGYSTASTAPQSWMNPEDIEFVYEGAYVWTEARCGVKRITGTALITRIIMDQPCFDWATTIYATPLQAIWGRAPELIDPTSAESSLSFLNEGGEWYLDRKDGVLYYQPRPDENVRHEAVIAPVLEALVEGEGAEGQPLHDVTFRGLTFAHATWLTPNEPTGFLQVAWSMYYNGGEVGAEEFPEDEDNVTTPGNVAFRHSERIELIGNRFTQLGAEAIEISSSSSGNRVVGNEITDVSGGGIDVGVMAPDVTGDNRDNRIENNWIHDVGVEYRGSVGINVKRTSDTTVAHNQVNELPYSGIVFEGPGFGEDAPEGGEVETSTARQHILDNRVFNTMNVLVDGGGIYASGWQGTSYETGALVKGNVVHDSVNPYNVAIYVESSPSFTTVEENVIFRNDHAFGGEFVSDVIVAGNFWDDDQPSHRFSPPERVTLEDNTLLPRDGFEAACAALAACAAIDADAGPTPPYSARLGLE